MPPQFLNLKVIAYFKGVQSLLVVEIGEWLNEQNGNLRIFFQRYRVMSAFAL